MRHSSFITRFIPLLFTLAVACGTSASQPLAHDPTGSPTGDPTPGQPDLAPAADSQVSEAPGVPAASPRSAVPNPPEPTWRGDYCQSDAECAWDHTCFPRRCVGARQAVESACDKTTPPPGQCLCMESMCSLRPDASYLSQLAYERRDIDASCRTDADCAVDVASATCHAGGRTRIGPMRQEGSLCTCDPTSKQCVFSWSEPVACTSWRECSWVKEPRLRPVSAKTVPRPIERKVRACKDSEVDSVCTTDGVCQVVRWKC